MTFSFSPISPSPGYTSTAALDEHHSTESEHVLSLPKEGEEVSSASDVCNRSIAKPVFEAQQSPPKTPRSLVGPPAPFSSPSAFDCLRPSPSAFEEQESDGLRKSGKRKADTLESSSWDTPKATSSDTVRKAQSLSPCTPWTPSPSPPPRSIPGAPSAPAASSGGLVAPSEDEDTTLLQIEKWLMSDEEGSQRSGRDLLSSFVDHPQGLMQLLQPGRSVSLLLATASCLALKAEDPKLQNQAITLFQSLSIPENAVLLRKELRTLLTHTLTPSIQQEVSNLLKIGETAREADHHQKEEF